MNTNNPCEIEIKLLLNDQTAVEQKLSESGFILHQPRLFEKNVVWDTSAGSLKKTGRLLRLRQYGRQTILTVKRQVTSPLPYKIREEIETGVEDFEKASAALDMLGYQPFFIYEKFRTIYTQEAAHVMIDETPIGNYLEIEAAPEEIDRIATLLGFSRNAYLTSSYYSLFLASGRRGHMIFSPA